VHARRAVFLLVLVALAGGAFLVLRGDDAPSYSPLDLADDPFAYSEDRQEEFERRAAAGHSHPVYVKSPGGIVAAAERVARYREGVESAAEEAGVSADLVEGMVLLESAGLPDARASDDLEGAVGLTQILAQTATGLLGMRVDLEESERLTRRLGPARSPEQADRLRARRAEADERFDPGRALAATGRYLGVALDELGREDLAVVSYHMGIGNLQNVLAAYGEDDPSYAQLYFDASPDRHPRAYRLLAGLGDDSKTYLWRVLASAEIMRLHREEPAELETLARLHEGADSAALVLHPPGKDAGADPERTASAVLAYIRRGVREISGVRAPLRVARRGPGFSFEIRRDYANGRQAEAFQYMLDRLQALNLIAWTRSERTIRITASSEGAELAQ
jgi:hypothetical protein